jgi:hypothetical protein
MGYIKDFQVKLLELPRTLTTREDADAIVSIVCDKLVESYRNGLLDGKKPPQLEFRPRGARAWGRRAKTWSRSPLFSRADLPAGSSGSVRSTSADPAVLVDNITDPMAYVWRQGGTDQTPLFARWVGNLLRALYEKKLTLVEAEHLVDRVRNQIRHMLTSDMADKSSRQDWQFAGTLSPRDFEVQIGSTANRLQRFIRNQTRRHMFGQPAVSLDLGKAMEHGSIILVSLATERAKVSKENAELFAQPADEG